MEDLQARNPAVPRPMRRASDLLCWIAIVMTTFLCGFAISLSPQQEFFFFTGPVVIHPMVKEAGHIKTPDEVRGVYLTSGTAGSDSLRGNVAAYVQRNGLNSMVIDVKDFGGKLAFAPDSPILKKETSGRTTIRDLDAMLGDLGRRGIYRIARIAVFQDPVYAERHPDQAVIRPGGGIWRDRKGISWVDPASTKAWAYNAAIAKEAYERGFDEIQFDYIRFPSDGNMNAIAYTQYDGKKPKREVIGAFFKYMHDNLEAKGIPVSYDLFGFTAWHENDLGIGQMMEDALPYGVAVSAMVYPSHYPKGTLNFSNPADHPYEIVADSLTKANQLYARRDSECKAIEAAQAPAEAGSVPVAHAAAPPAKPAIPCGVKLAAQRPWLQAFDLGAVYTPEMIRAQIKAARDTGAGGYLLWNARNVYKDIR